MGIIKSAWPEPFLTVASGYSRPSLLQLLINLDYISGPCLQILFSLWRQHGSPRSFCSALLLSILQKILTLSPLLHRKFGVIKKTALFPLGKDTGICV